MFGAFFLADVSCKNNYCLLIKNINTSVLEFVFLVSLFTITERIEQSFGGLFFTKSSRVIAYSQLKMLLISVPTVNLYSVSAVCLMLYVAVYTLYSVRMQWVVLITSKTRFLLELVITKGYGMRATTIESQNAFAPTLCFA